MTTTTTRYESGISENNLRHWGITEVLKEFIQNNVYAGTVLGDKTAIEYKEVSGCMCAVISNTPSGFTRGKLLIGESEQADVAGAPGQYGEGMKVAMAVAKRLGRACQVHTNGFVISPQLESSSLDSSVNVLVYYLLDTNKHEGTTFMIECTSEELEEAKSYFAILNGVSKEVISTNCIIVDEATPGTLYVNGVKITQVPGLFSYNFTSAELMNRDRTSVDMQKVYSEVSTILGGTSAPEVAAYVLSGILENDTVLEASITPKYYVDNINAWREGAEYLWGKKVAVATGGDSDTQARYLNYRILTKVPTRWLYFFINTLNIKYTSDLDELAKKLTNRTTKTSTDENVTLGWAKGLIKRYYADYGTVRVADQVTDQHGNICNGLYEPKSGITWISKHILDSKKETFKTLLHETIHRVTGADDNTAEFTEAWADASWAILNKGNARVGN